MGTAFDHGWREWWTALDPVLAPIRNEPVMQRLLAEIDRALDEQRDRARSEYVALAP
jgi:hypothetical protein